ncbi:hypothetical protein [Rhodospira trueperi]|uniref:Uncharacterized protein n=1 Tax=Rhodospira trueperi TaxID=69960 RepID=A0A1G6ZVU6_9PROT|nr:hypothetical protein [Rhodospira trueperi]SDE05975.1 hypothetical protein SAMN05421720_10333 [Rhodospira trueperi]
MESVQNHDAPRDTPGPRPAEQHRAHRKEGAGEDVRRQARDLITFLASLERRIATLRDSGHVLEADEDHPSRFTDYARTRNLTSECLAFLIVIDRRIDALPDHMQAEPRGILESHTITLWGTLLECSLAFLRTIADQAQLPLGSREVFVREIKTLHDAHAILSQDRFAGKVPQSTMDKQTQAERILNEVIDRAPRLLDLG